MATLQGSLSYKPRELDFGTSGLRGLVTDMTDLECYINVFGFLTYIQQSQKIKKADTVLLAGDLRDSTPRILRAVAEAIADRGFKIRYCGKIPTPALAYKGLQENKLSIMVTGSHIPADRNGIKFYKLGGEILKDDEAGIKQAVAEVRKRLYGEEATASKFNKDGELVRKQVVLSLGKPDGTAATEYMTRYTQSFPEALAGKQIVVYQHSAVGRDMLVTILEALGAIVVPYGRSETFIPIDTENVTAADERLFKQIAKDYPDNLAIVSTDGDSDRPFVIDSHGTFYRGDVLGCLVAEYLGADYAAVPISSNDAVDAFFSQKSIELEHTKIGSPYVIKAMLQAVPGHKVVVGWEVNGGFMTATDTKVGDGLLKSLPTRDAFLPIIVALVSAIDQNTSVKQLFEQLPQRFTGGGLVDNVDITKITKFKQKVSAVEYTADQIAQLLDVSKEEIKSIDVTDGLRILFTDGQIVHFRPSGNAPQMRVYTNCDSQEAADKIVAAAVKPNGYLEKLLSHI